MAAQNDYGVTVPGMALATTKTYHGLTIISETGQIVGRVQSYTPVFAKRAGSHVYELNAYTFGRPIDYVPGIESGRSLSCTRIETWEEEAEIAFGSSQDIARLGRTEWSDLCDQTAPFIFQEAFFRANTRYRAWEYLGCWFTSKSFNSFSADGDAKVVASLEMAYIIRKQLQ
jgi:hypothetical protein